MWICFSTFPVNYFEKCIWWAIKINLTSHKKLQTGSVYRKWDSAQLSLITLCRQIGHKSLLIIPKFHHTKKTNDCLDFFVDILGRLNPFLEQLMWVICVFHKNQKCRYIIQKNIICSNTKSSSLLFFLSSKWQLHLWSTKSTYNSTNLFWTIKTIKPEDIFKYFTKTSHNVF